MKWESDLGEQIEEGCGCSGKPGTQRNTQNLFSRSKLQDVIQMIFFYGDLGKKICFMFGGLDQRPKDFGSEYSITFIQ